MSEPLDESYLRWLHDQVLTTGRRAKSRSYWTLLRVMYTREFVWFVPNDDNRVEDGKALRVEFLEQTKIEASVDWLDLGCSFLEMLIGVSRRLSFDTNIPTQDWFWHLVGNLGLSGQNDRDVVEAEVEEAVDTVIWRTYSRDGSGGLFPLRSPARDQSKVELWYQMGAYIMEME